jgi:LEA14-like dessication related protein
LLVGYTVKNRALIVILVLLCGLTGCLQPQMPTLEYQDTEIRFSSLSKIDTRFNFQLNNPNPLPLRGELEYAIFLDEQKLFAGKSAPIKVNGQESIDFALVNELDLLVIYKDLSALLERIGAGQKELSYKVEGTYSSSTKILPLEIPVVLEGRIELPKIPAWKLIAVDIKSFDLDGMILEVKTNLINENEFPITIDKMLYQLTEGEKVFFQGELEKAVNIEGDASQNIFWQLKINYTQLDKELINKFKSGEFDPGLRRLYKSIH